VASDGGRHDCLFTLQAVDDLQMGFDAQVVPGEKGVTGWVAMAYLVIDCHRLIHGGGSLRGHGRNVRHSGRERHGCGHRNMRG
jgi:hypothetical protein